MCNHKFNNDKNKSCEWDKFFSQMCLKETGIPDDMLNLPHDSTGECIFHSRDLEWKREKKLSEWIKRLFFLFDNYDNENDEIELEDVVFVGDTLLNEQNWIHKMMTDSENDLYCYTLKNMFCKKSLSFVNAKFEDIIILDRCCLKKDLTLHNCHFSKGITINNLTIGEDLNIWDCHFQKKIIITSDKNRKNTTYGKWHIENSTFVGDSIFGQLIITESCDIVGNKFEPTEYEICFNCRFLAGLNFIANSATNLKFSFCEFNDGSTFDELKLLGTFSMFDPKIKGHLKFIGDSNNLLFDHNTTIAINLGCFEKNGKITFEFCNLFGLGSIFDDNYDSLVKFNKIELINCRRHRIFSDTITIKSDRINHSIIEELTQSFANYYLHSEGTNLGVEFISKKINNLQLYYFTEENITREEFISRLKNIRNKYLDPSRIEKTKEKIYKALPDKSNEENTSFLDEIDEYLSYLGIRTKILALESINLLTEEHLKKLLKVLLSDNIKQLNVFLMGDYTDKSQHQTFNGNITNSDIKQIGVVGKIDSSTTNNDIKIETPKTPLWKKIAVGVVIMVIASAIWHFIQILL